MKRVPKTGEILKFYDDGKIGPSRRYWAKVVNVVRYKEARNIMLDGIPVEEGKLTSSSLIKQWKINVESCDWIYADETDYFIECYIPAYDDNNIWFVRSKHGGWFSIDVQSFWQCGVLDVDNTWYPEDPDDYMTYWETTWEDDLKHIYKRQNNEGLHS